MNEHYLAADLEPLKAIGDSKVFEGINNTLNYYNESNEPSAVLAAYSIKCPHKIYTIYCLFKSENGLMYRRFEYYPGVEKVEDDLKLTADYGLGIHEYEIENYLKLRDFYLEHIT